MECSLIRGFRKLCSESQLCSSTLGKSLLFARLCFLVCENGVLELELSKGLSSKMTAHLAEGEAGLTSFGVSLLSLVPERVVFRGRL